MALHKVIYPKSATLLFRVVALQKKLLKAIAVPGLNAGAIDVAWMQGVWHRQDAEWVRKFCLGGKDSAIHPLKKIAAAPLPARLALLGEFIRQNQVKSVLDGGGNFHELITLPGFTPQLVASVKLLFGRFYKLLGHNTAENWAGYEFRDGTVLANRQYKDEFCATPPTSEVCPYCDGEIGTSELDHYYAKSSYPLLACSPWNLIPICSSCNNHVTAKGDQPTLSPGPPPSADDWLHPYFRPATVNVSIRLTGGPRDSIPRLHSADPMELRRVTNHFELINKTKTNSPSLSLSKRWTKGVSGYFDRLVARAQRKSVVGHAALTTFIDDEYGEHIASRGKAPSSMIKAAVCQAILDGRPEYENEFSDSNPPTLI